jgi:hypothetical protein
MKIGIPQPPQSSLWPSSERGIGGDADPAASGGFEQLLEAMRLAMESPDGQAAAPQPEIGSHSQAFEKAQLLVETSLDLSNGSTPAGRDGADRPISEHHAEIVAKVGDLLERLAARFAPHPIQAGEPVEAGPAGIAEPGRDVRLAQTDFPRAPLASRPIVHLPAEAAIRHAPGPARAPSRSVAPQGRPPLPPGTGSGQLSRFAAQLLATEGGLRVLLRLPHLSDAERGDLELRLGRLLESFGHRRSEIVIHETATA